MNEQKQNQIIAQINNDFPLLSLKDRLSFIGAHFSNPTFTTSLGIEDQAISWAIANSTKSIKIVTLQTGRLFSESLELINKTKNHFNIDIAEYQPDVKELQDYIEQYSLNGFYDSKQARLACCYVRKISPLKRALKKADSWITGLRGEQSNNRSDILFAQFDNEHDLVKLNPLADISLDELKQIIADNKIPINPLHEKNYPSIGCEPCTRAIKQGEDERAGRWWWENDEKKECGLHFSENEQQIISEQQVIS